MIIVNRNKPAELEISNIDVHRLKSELRPSQMLDIHGEMISVGEFLRDYLPNMGRRDLTLKVE